MADDQKPPAATPAAAESAQPEWRALVEQHTGWRERAPRYRVNWLPDGVEVPDCTPEDGAALQDVLNTLGLYGFTVRISRNPNRPGIRAGIS